MSSQQHLGTPSSQVADQSSPVTSSNPHWQNGLPANTAQRYGAHDVTNRPLDEPVTTISLDEDDEDDDWFAPKGGPVKATVGSPKIVKITKPPTPK
ncbi:hypothetical protein C8Q74DRAFT_1364861 [Fomes fomentarius]|nr:hypothetical protein C8Q74DRAFT_1364861 [Fomes fomentarius]